MTPRYQRSLEEFVRESNGLIDEGLAHFVVILSHELYRFLYPVEPHAEFQHEDPIPWVEDHINRLVAQAKAARSLFCGYKDRGMVEAYVGKSDRHREDLRTVTSELYSSLWKGFSPECYTEESRRLISSRLGEAFIGEAITGKRCLDMGCGSGRYAMALALLGADEVVAVDFQSKAFADAEALSKELELLITFREADVLSLPFEDDAFQTVFSNGVLHHTQDWRQGVTEFARVLQPGGNGFLYLYGRGGIFWETRNTLRQVFTRIPAELTRSVLRDLGMPGNRFVFMDTWYVPVEDQLGRQELEEELARHQLAAERLLSINPFDLDTEAVLNLPGHEAMWGEREHRYWLRAA